MSSVIVVGAGLAGLNCAQILSKSGLEVTVLEASDRIGGRVKSDYIDGFTCDHGFQVINPKYSELQRTGVVEDLNIKTLPKGFEINIGGKDFRLGDFRKNLSYLPGDLASRTGSLKEKINFLKFVAWPGKDRPLGEALTASGDFYRKTMKGFLDGVFLTDSDSVSSEMAHEIIRWFVKGSPGVPERGVAQLSALMSRGLNIRLNTEVIQIRDGLVQTKDFEISGDYVVIATNALQKKRLVGGEDVLMHYSATWYHAIENGLITSDHLRLSADSTLVNSVVISNVAPSYAPSGRSLISSTTLHARTETEISRAVAELWGISEREMDLVARYEIPHSLPRHLSGKGLVSPQRVSKNVFLAGDDFAIPAQQGALMSGRLAAEAIIADR